MSFNGTFDYTLDAKNRLTVPSRFRHSLSGPLILARSQSAPCVTISTKEDFDAFVAGALEPYGPLDRQRDKINRFFRSTSFDAELDAAGRVMIPADLMEYAGISKDVVVNGVGDKVEVWDRTAWSSYEEDLNLDDLL